MHLQGSWKLAFRQSAIVVRWLLLDYEAGSEIAVRCFTACIIYLLTACDFPFYPKAITLPVGQEPSLEAIKHRVVSVSGKGEGGGSVLCLHE